MNEIQLIKTRVNDNNEVIVSARELYEFLEVSERYSKWFDRMKDYGFELNEDYTPYQMVHPQNNQEILDHVIKLDMAKEIAMIQRSEKGKQARQYFLAIEKAWNSPERIMERALQFAKQRAEEAERLILEQKHKVLLAESIENTNDLIGIGELAKIIKQNGYDIGQNRLFKWLRDNKYLMYLNRENIPTQYAMDRGWFRVIERTVNDGKEIKIKFTTKVTGKGQLYFVNKFLADFN